MSFTGNVTAVLDKDVSSMLGKKGTASDVTLYNHKQGECILSFINPSSYPDKVQSLVTSLAMSDQVLLKIDALNANVAETIVALDSMKAERGFIVLGESMFEESLKAVAKGSVISSYPVISFQPAEVRERLANLRLSSEGDALILIDHSFQVKGVGTVALGVVKQGVISKHDEIFLYPSKEKTLIKSIQVHDNDVASAETGVRVGFALKDITPEDIPRGTLISTKESLNISKEIALDFSLSKYSPRELKAGDIFLAASNLNYTPAKIVEGALKPGETGRIKLSLEKEITILPGRLLLLDPSQKMPRVIGGGQL